MKIIIAIDNFRIGGAERVASLIANELSKQHEVHAIIFEKEIRYPIESKVTIHYVLPENSGRISKIIKRLNEYRKLINQIQPDVIYSFAYVGIYAAFGKLLSKNKTAKLICSERTDPTKEPSSNITRLLRDWAYSKSDTLVCQTKIVVNYFKSKGMNVNYKVIPNPVKEDLPHWENNNSKTFVTACRLAKQKNIPLMLNAFKEFSYKYSGYKLDIYGEGEEKENLTHLISDLGLGQNVSIKPFSTDIHNIMAKSLAYVSSSDYEGISNSMLEALAIGLPTICTDCPIGGAGMFIENLKNGILVPVNDKDSLSQGFEKIVSGELNLTEMSQNAKRIRIDINPQKIVNEWLTLID